MKIIITKLKTSRKTNSERYIVCKNMQEYIDDNILQKLYEVILKWDNYTEQNKKIIDIFSFEIDKFL